MTRLREYRYDIESEGYSKSSDSTWRLTLTLLIDKDPSVEWIDIKSGRFQVKNSDDFIQSIKKLTNGKRILTKSQINIRLDQHQTHLFYHQNNEFSFIQFQKLINFEVS